jgi:ATP:ADP antiporter, AAA family
MDSERRRRILSEARAPLVIPLTAAALIAQQVGTIAIRDGVFLSSFPVSALPYFMAGAALLALPMAPLSGRAMARFGPVRVVPALVGANTLLFVAEYALLGRDPRAASVLLYLHSAVLGVVTISSFWSLLNERYDPHSAKALLARVAAAASMGGLAGGVGAERVAALWSQGTLLVILALVSVAVLAGVVAVGREMPGAGRRPAERERASGWVRIRRQALLRDLALVVVLAAFLRVLVDYALKAEAVAHFGRGPGLVRFFGLFYAGTSLLSVLIQVTSGSFVLGRLGLGGSVAVHPALVGVAAAVGLVVPFPWRGLVPRAVDAGVGSSVFRAGYELLYTPIAEATKRSAKPLVDVACDSAGKVLGAGLVLLLARIVPEGGLLAVNLAMLVAAAAEFHVASRLKAGYVGALEGGLRRGDLEQAAQYSLTDFTAVGSLAGLDREAIRRALEAGGAPANDPPEDPVLAALADFRSGDLGRTRAALEHLPRDPVVIGALVPLLARDELVRPVVSALGSFGSRAAGEMVSALLDPATPDVVRRRLPPALRSSPSPIARDGLLAGLSLPAFEVRLRCGRALLALTDEHPGLMVPFPGALAAVEAELQVEAEPRLLREHVFNLLALAFEREPVRIASRAVDAEDAYVRGTALEYLETILPARVFSSLRKHLAAPAGAAPQRPRPTDEVRAELIRAGATMTVSLEELRRQLDAAARDES